MPFPTTVSPTGAIYGTRVCCQNQRTDVACVISPVFVGAGVRVCSSDTCSHVCGSVWLPCRWCLPFTGCPLPPGSSPGCCRSLGSLPRLELGMHTAHGLRVYPAVPSLSAPTSARRFQTGHPQSGSLGRHSAGNTFLMSGRHFVTGRFSCLKKKTTKPQQQTKQRNLSRRIRTSRHLEAFFPKHSAGA